MGYRNAALLLGAGALGIALWARSRRSKDVTAGRTHASRSVTIRADAGRLHELWKQPERFATVFARVEMEIVAEEPGKLYEWRTPARAPYRGGGSLTFTPAPADRGTQARLALFLEGVGAPAANAARRLFGASLEQHAMETMRRFKAFAEAGEVPHAVSAT